MDMGNEVKENPHLLFKVGHHKSLLEAGAKLGAWQGVKIAN